jgi:GNAT superfamily N-acetyltransferase
MSVADYQIRRIEPSERSQWDCLWKGYLEFYKSTLADAVSDLLWQRICDAENEIQCRVAVSAEGELVGLVHFFPHAHTWYAEPVCYLNDLFVKPEIRSAGLGERLIQAVVEEGRKQGWAEIYWLTQTENQVARGLYDKITGGSDGFVNYVIELSN